MVKQCGEKLQAERLSTRVPPTPPLHAIVRRRVISKNPTFRGYCWYAYVSGHDGSEFDIGLTIWGMYERGREALIARSLQYLLKIKNLIQKVNWEKNKTETETIVFRRNFNTINNRQFSILNVHYFKITKKTHKPIIIALKIWKKSC